MSLNIASSIDFSKFSSTDWNEHPREPRSNSLLNEISRDLETATCARSGSFGLVQRRKLWTVSRRKEERYREEWSRGRAKIDAPGEIIREQIYGIGIEAHWRTRKSFIFSTRRSQGARLDRHANVQDSHLPANSHPLAAITSETYPTVFFAKLNRVHRITCGISSLHRYASSLANFIYFILCE